MSKVVVYEGVTPAERTKKGLPPFGALEYHIEDEDGELCRLSEGLPVPVSDELAKELLEGSDRTKGHKFREGSKEEAEAVGEEPSQPEPEPDVAAGGGPAGSGPATSGEPTTTAAARR